MSYAETIEYLYSLQKHGTKLGLANTRVLMELLGNPHESFRSIHIAGTNGKGSTSAMLAFILKKTGYKVGLYTSPHLISFTERIRVNNQQIPEERVVALTEKLKSKIATLEEPFIPTFFEFTTTLAFAWFVEQGIDIAVVETGMGGRLDSTNIITPLVSVITTVDLDHQEFLGERLVDIAGEKAGIIKAGVPVVTGEQKAEALRVIESAGITSNAALYRTGRDCGVSSVVSGIDGSTFDYRGLEGEVSAYRTPMIGKHQVDNACLALLTVEVLKRAGLALPQAAVQDGLAAARWDGRLEKIGEKPLVLLDGAHNPAAAERLADALRDVFAGQYERLILLLGILGDKDMEGIIRPLAPMADRVIVAPPDYYRASLPDPMKKVVRKYNPNVEASPSIAKAIETALAGASERDLICITGSLFTAGEARGIILGSRDAGPVMSSLAGLKG